MQKFLPEYSYQKNKSVTKKIRISPPSPTILPQMHSLIYNVCTTKILYCKQSIIMTNYAKYLVAMHSFQFIGQSSHLTFSKLDLVRKVECLPAHKGNKFFWAIYVRKHTSTSCSDLPLHFHVTRGAHQNDTSSPSEYLYSGLEGKL